MENRIPIVRPDFVDYFLAMAIVASKRSHDMQTQHGCVITDDQNRVLSVGYNGFPRGMNDNSLPNTRPEKYFFMCHAERNALANCSVRPDNGIAYVTGEGCLDCGMALWQHGIKTIYMIDRHGSKLNDDKMRENWKTFHKQTGIKIYKVKPDLAWTKNIFE